jgi:tripartite-type tricarboxylate transporter receptor subunit TctC
MDRRRAMCSVLALAVGAEADVLQAADPFPSKPVKIIVPFPAGSITDVYARRTAHHLAPALGQPVIVENRPGASGTIGVALGAKAKPDGYTITLATSSNLAIAPAVGMSLGFDPVHDLQPVTALVRTPMVLVVQPSLNVRKLAELVALAKARPGQLAYASGGAANTPHIAAEVLRHVAGIDLLHVPYNTGRITAAMLGNEVQLGFDWPVTAIAHVRSGRFRALLITGPRRVPLLPDVPTASEAGYPELEIYGWAGYLVPKGTPRRIVVRLNTELVKALRSTQIKAALEQEGGELGGDSPEAFAAFIRAEQAKFARIVQTTGIRLDQ